MSWRSGAQLFADIWPHIQARVRDRALRQEFLGQLLPIFLEWDADPESIAEVHAEVREALIALGAEVSEPSDAEEDVADCIRQLSNADEKTRADAAEALEFFVHQADDPGKTAVMALRALLKALRDASVKVRRAAASSIVELVPDFGASKEVRRKLMQAAADNDPIVRKRIADAIKKAEKSGKGRASQ